MRQHRDKGRDRDSVEQGKARTGWDEIIRWLEKGRIDNHEAQLFWPTLPRTRDNFASHGGTRPSAGFYEKISNLESQEKANLHQDLQMEQNEMKFSKRVLLSISSFVQIKWIETWHKWEV